MSPEDRYSEAFKILLHPKLTIKAEEGIIDEGIKSANFAFQERVGANPIHDGLACVIPEATEVLDTTVISGGRDC